MFSKTFFTIASVALAAQSVLAAPASVLDWDVQSAALAYVGKQWNVTPLYYVHFDSAIVGTDASYAFLRQQVNSQPVDNTFATVTFDANHNVQSFKSYYVPQTRVEANLPNISQEAAVSSVTTAFPNLSWTSEAENYAYFIRPDGHAVFTFILHFNSGETTYRANVNTLDGTIESLTNTITGASIATH